MIVITGFMEKTLLDRLDESTTHILLENTATGKTATLPCSPDQVKAIVVLLASPGEAEPEAETWSPEKPPARAKGQQQSALVEDDEEPPLRPRHAPLPIFNPSGGEI